MLHTWRTLPEEAQDKDKTLGQNAALQNENSTNWNPGHLVTLSENSI